MSIFPWLALGALSTIWLLLFVRLLELFRPRFALLISMGFLLIATVLLGIGIHLAGRLA